MKPETINRQAKELLDNSKITARLDFLKLEHGRRHNVTVDDIIAELEEARQLALKTDKAGPAVQASMGKARLYGFDKVILDHMSSDGTMRPTAPVYNIVNK